MEIVLIRWSGFTLILRSFLAVFDVLLLLLLVRLEGFQCCSIARSLLRPDGFCCCGFLGGMVVCSCPF